VVVSAAGALYGAAMTFRRRWYEREPRRQRRLAQPVVSVGNLRWGGSGKTPTVQYVARLLLERGERPAILTRGYGRRGGSGTLVVSDGTSVLADVDAAGDEPLLLARTLTGVPVVVGANRYESGRIAESRFGATVHLLDDGFQHLALARDVDLLLVSEDDVVARVLPAGPLREPLASAVSADALLVNASYAAAAERMGRLLNVATTFFVTHTLRAPRLIASGETVVVPGGDPVYAVAGIARPERFFSDLTTAGWRVADTMAFRDHHRFTERDIGRIAAGARAIRAAIVLTTEKDAVRLSARNLSGLPIASVPLEIAIEPRERFADWLLARIR
jgi:tetraacyldisaccharide 4'-kinase